MRGTKNVADDSDGGIAAIAGIGKHLIGGWRSRALYVIGVRTGSGKTRVGLQAAMNMLHRGLVLMCTLEMREGEIHKRVFSQLLHIPLGNILDSNMTPNEWERLTNRKATNRDRFYVDDNPARTVEGIRRRRL
ncbi:DnaB-like helicase C-terminal domain-containing protein [Brevibacterium metallidurans]|uniref:SF4 helicase domain-containing protein n=1 Tax=Brevibacterium metallidurans TaxID=1482676 RepID=A0ABP3CD40_9MICO